MQQNEMRVLRRARRIRLSVGLSTFALLLIALVISVSLGAMALSFEDAVRIIAGNVLSRETWLAGYGKNEIAVIWAIRLPRVLSAALCGAGLAVSGAVFQSLLGNPLADPYTLGISTGAAFGATAVIYANVIYGMALPVTPVAFAMALITLLVVLSMATKNHGIQTDRLVIAGMIVSTILSAAISFLKKLSGESVGAIVYWLMGSITGKQWADVSLLFYVLMPCMALCLWGSGDLNLMSLGDQTAQALGVHTQRTRALFLCCGALMTAACVSTCGIIGFVGLIIPHMLRMWLTSDNRALLPISALLGGLLLLIADDVSRLVGTGDMPVGVLTTLLGGPFFIYLFLRRRAV